MSKLSAIKVQKTSKPGRYGDGDGLYLQVSKWGTKAWVFRYACSGRERQMGLGPLNTLGLADARERARRARQMLLDGVDPIDERLAKKSQDVEARARAVTFKHCADRFLSAHESGWRNEKHRAEWKSAMERFAHPTLGALPVSSIDAALVLKVLEPIWNEKRETADRLGANRLHVMVASNDDWVVPATGDERRYVLARANDRWRGKTAKWDALNRELEDGGHGAMLFDLMMHDLPAAWHPQASAPNTRALMEQKLRGLGPVAKWWLQILEEGVLPFDTCGSDWSRWPARAFRQDVVDSIAEWRRRERTVGTSIDRFSFQELKRVCPGARVELWDKVPEGRTDIRCEQKRRRARAVELPPLGRCRADFEVAMGGRVEWPEA